MVERPARQRLRPPRRGCPMHDVAADFKPFDLESVRLLERARREQPVFFSEELGYWVVTRHDDIHAIFKDPATFSSENTQAPYKPRPPEVQAILDDGEFTRLLRAVSARQPPDHTRLRGFIKKAFTPRRVAVLEPQIRELATRDARRDRRHAARSTSSPSLTYELPGARHLPPARRARRGRRRTSRVGGQPRLPQLRRPRRSRSRASTRTTSCATGATAWSSSSRASSDPRDDLPSDLARIYHEGDHSLSSDEMAGLVYTQLTAGHETTSLAARRRPQGAADRSAGAGRTSARDPELIPTRASRSCCASSTPVFAWRRLTKKPATVGDVDLPEGSRVAALLGLGEPRRDDVRAPRGASTSTARTPATTSPSDTASTSASAHRWRGWRPRSCCDELTRRMPDLRPRRRPGLRVPAEHDVPRADERARRAAPGVRPRPRLRPLRQREVARVGGKAASLGTMLQAGFPVPDGFAVTTGAFRETLGSDVAGRISRDLAALDTDDVTALEAAAARLRLLVETTPLRRTSRTRSATRTPRSATTSRSRCARAPRRRTARRTPSPASTTRTCGSSAPTRSSTQSALLGEPVLRPRRRLPRATAASRTTTWRWPSSSSGWCRRAPRAWR